jgi:lipoate-protein ligase A
MFRQKLIMPIEEVVPTWSILPREYGLSRKDLLAIKIRQLERRQEDIEISIKRLKEAREKNKERFDRKHWLQPKAIQNGN